MAFDIKAHIESHAELTFDNMSAKTVEAIQGDAKRLHFKASIDIAQLIANGYDTQDKIDNLMKNILTDIQKNGLVEYEKNGTYQTKDGPKERKLRKRVKSVDDVLMAYHSRDLNENLTVEPHFHFLTTLKDENGKPRRFGKNFSAFRNGLQKVYGDKLGLVFHFAEETAMTNAAGNLGTTTTRFSWEIQRMTDDEVKEYFTTHSDEAAKRVKLMHERCMQDGNIQFFIKTMTRLNERLIRTDTDFQVDGHNLKYDYSLPLRPEQHQTITVLQEGDPEKINRLLQDRSNIIARDYVKFCHGFHAPVIEALNRNFDTKVIRPIDKELLDLSGMKVTAKAQYDTAPLEVTEEGGVTVGNARGGVHNPLADKSKYARNGTGQYYESVKRDIMNAAAVSVNEKEFKAAMSKRGYDKCGFRTKDKEKIGIRFKNKRGKTQYIYYDKLGMAHSDIISMLMSNAKLLEQEDMALLAARNIEASQASIFGEREKHREEEHRGRVGSVEFIELNIAYRLTYQQEKLYSIYDYITPMKLSGHYVFQDEQSKAVIIGNKQQEYKVIDKGDGSITAKGKGADSDERLEAEIRLMFEVAMAKGWNVERVGFEGSAAFVRKALQIQTELIAQGGRSGETGPMPEMRA